MAETGVTEAPILDLYAPLNHKALLGSPTKSGSGWHAPSWVGKEHTRRLDAYRILEAYYQNNGRYFVADLSADDRGARREYGDAGAIVDAIKSALLGESQTISIAGAEEFREDLPDDATEDDQIRNAEAERAVIRLELLNQWANDERLLIKLNGAESKAGRLGDGVYELVWSNARSRPRLRTYDPGFYFPVLKDIDDEYPNRIHLAWEIATNNLTSDKKRPNRTLVRRITYELAPIESPTDEGGFSIVTDDGPVEPDNATFRDGAYWRELPWNEEETNLTCYVSDATWEIETGKATIDDFTGQTAIWTLNEEGIPLRRMDLGIDFIPVIHIPNTAEEEEHFGASSLLRVAQLLDQLHASDSDLGDTAATSGTPAIGLEGGDGITNSTPTVDWGPGAVINNPNGTIKLLHTAEALEPLSKYSDSLLQRLSVNARVPASAMGRVDPSKVESGIHLALSWGPLRSMVAQMRLVRHEKYGLLLKFVQRFFMLDGQIEETEGILDAELVFGNFLPTDLSAAIENVTKLLTAKAISRRTAITMLVEAGLPIDDANEELKRIEEEELRETAAADLPGMLEVTGDPQVIGDILGVEVAPLAPGLPGLGGEE